MNDGEPLNYRFGGGASETILHPLVAAAMVLAIILIFCVRRRYVIVPFLGTIFLTPSGQQILIAGAHVFVSRFLILAVLLKVWLDKREKTKLVLASGWSRLDSFFSLAVLCHAVAFIVLNAEMSAFINQVGVIWDYLGCYIVLRILIRDDADIDLTIKCLAVVALICAGCMVQEQITGQNIFGILGGVRLVDEVRNGHVRSEAVFQHAILAGCFGATVAPLFILLWKTGKSRFLGILGFASAGVMAVTTFCSTPVLAFVSGLCGIGMWPLRKVTRAMRWGAVIALISLSLVMNAPVWFLIAHLGVMEGSSTAHRAELVNTFIEHFSEWWLFGTKDNGDWGYEMFDTSNTYVSEGVNGGLFALTFLIMTISTAFGRVGSARKSVERRIGNKAEWRFWLLGTAVLANATAFFGISYFDQTKVQWFALLAMISAATSVYGQGESELVTDASQHEWAEVHAEVQPAGICLDAWRRPSSLTDSPTPEDGMASRNATT